MEVLLVAIGAAAGLLSSLILETYRTRRDHERWMLDRRYDVYVKALGYVDSLLTWARDEATLPSDSSPPMSHDFHEFAAELALVGSETVQAAWKELDEAYRDFPMTHAAAVMAKQAVDNAKAADPELEGRAVSLRGNLAEIASRASECETALAKAMERDTKGKS